MKRVSIWLVTVACLVIGPAQVQAVEDPKDQPFSLLLHFNALDPNTPEEVSLKVGDLVLLSAERDQGMGMAGVVTAGRDRLAYTIEGEALEELTPLQTATPVRSQGDSPSAFLFGALDASRTPAPGHEAR